MRITSFNANGIRAAGRHGFLEWLPQLDADVVCIQETKARIEQLDGDPIYFPEPYHCFYEDARSRKGYAGVAMFSRREPDEVVRGFGAPEFDDEGRYLELRFDDFCIVSLYAPSGSSGDHRQESKDRFLDAFIEHLRILRASGRSYVICGDWNIAHKEIDLKNWKSNQKNSGFLPHERAWMDRVFHDIGWVDAFRVVNQQPDQYTWWSNRANAWANNVGWRIDYHVVTPDLREAIVGAEIFRDRKFSDHAPLTLEYDLEHFRG